jgi:EAL domain-containing protein (putative c-di-GMP-specific phosphodiesterase class I)
LTPSPVIATTFFLNYQPQFDLKSGRVTGIEALLRWQHPTRGRLAAAEFIHDAERARLMLPIGEWVLRTACPSSRRGSIPAFRCRSR